MNDEPEPIRYPMVSDIRAETASFYKLSLVDMVSQRRGAAIARPRQIAMYLSRHMTIKSLPQIGKLFGGRDHSTVIHAIKVVESRMGSDPQVKRAVRLIRARVLRKLEQAA